MQDFDYTLTWYHGSQQETDYTQGWKLNHTRQNRGKSVLSQTVTAHSVWGQHG